MVFGIPCSAFRAADLGASADEFTFVNCLTKPTQFFSLSFFLFSWCFFFFVYVLFGRRVAPMLPGLFLQLELFTPNIWHSKKDMKFMNTWRFILNHVTWTPHSNINYSYVTFDTPKRIQILDPSFSAENKMQTLMTIPCQTPGSWTWVWLSPSNSQTICKETIYTFKKLPCHSLWEIRYN